MIFIGTHLYEYFNNNYIELVSIQNCFSDNQNFWTYTFLINYNNKKKLITKRFSECYELINSLKNTTIHKYHILSNHTYNDTSQKGNILNIKFNNILNNRSILHNSLFTNFINNDNNYNNTTIIEKHILSDDHLSEENFYEIDDTNIDHLLDVEEEFDDCNDNNFKFSFE